MPVNPTLKNRLIEYNTLTPRQINLICSCFKTQRLAASEHFQEANQPVTQIAFIRKGTFRAYIIDETGKEVIKFFLEAGQFMVDVTGYQYSATAYLSFEALQPSQILTITVEDARQLCRQIPTLESIIDKLCIANLLTLNRSNDTFRNGTATQKLQRFIKIHPTLVGKIAQKYIARFIGVTQQSFSRISQ